MSAKIANPTIQAANPPTIDTVVLPASGNVAATEVSFQISSELMKNSQKASPISPTKHIRAAQNNQGKPLIFTIGTDQRFQLLKSDVAATGWTSYDLSAGFAEYEAVKAFDVSQDSQGRISVAVALSKKGAVNTDIYIASLLSADDAKTDWSKLAEKSQLLKGVDSAFVAEQIRLGTSESNHTPLVVISGDIGGQKYYYQSVDVDQGAVKLEFPENVSPDSNALMDVSLGHAFGQRGVFFLYKIGDTETLECTTLRDSEEGPQHYDYSPGNQEIPAGLRNLRYNCIATPTASQNNPDRISSDIYVGTNTGIYLFRDAKVGSLQKVTDQIADVHEIIVRQDNDSISVWAVSSPSNLYYVYGKKGATYTWNPPILFNPSVLHVAPIRNVAKQSNELILVNQDLSVTHSWQDPTSTLWQRRTIKVGSKGYLFDFESFTTQIHLEDQDGNPLANQTLRITASEWTYLTVNGLVYSFDQDNAAEIKTDPLGNVTIISMATDIATPILHVEGDFFDKTLNIYPNGKIHKALEICTGNDLQKVQNQKDEAGSRKVYDQSTLDGVASNLQQVAGASNQYIVGSRSKTDVFVAVEDKGVKHTGMLSVAHLPSDFAVGMTLKDGQWRFHSDAVRVVARPNDIIDDIIEFAGDALHLLETEFEEGIKLVEKGVVYLEQGASFVVQKVKDGLDDALVFVLKFGEKVLNIALKTLGSIFKVLNWILKQIGIALKEILAWLGHLFGWDDIWDTHKIIAAMVTHGLDYAVGCVDSQVDNWRAGIKTTFANIKTDIANLVAPPDLKSWQPRSIPNSITKSNPGISWNSPQASFAGYQLQHGGMLESTGARSASMVATPRGAVGDPFVQFINDVVSPTLSTLLTDLEKDLDELKRLATDPSQTLEHVLALVKDLAVTVLDPLATIADGLLKFFKDLLSDVKSAVEAEIDIPFLSDFYEFITAFLGEEEKFTFINGLSLLLAIPIVEISKIITGDAPLSDGSHGLDNADLFVKLIGPASNPRATLPKEKFVPQTGIAVRKLDASADKTKFSADHWYSRLGAIFASGAVILEKILEVYVLTKDNASGDTTKKLGRAEIGQLVLYLVKTAGTFPVAQHTLDDAGERTVQGLKVTSWAISFIQDVWGVFLSGVLKGILLAAADFVVLALTLSADIYSLVEGSGSGWTLANDIASNVSGFFFGVGQATAEEAKDPATKAIGGALGGIGFVGGFGAAVSVFIQASVLDGSEILHAVNVGG